MILTLKENIILMALTTDVNLFFTIASWLFEGIREALALDLGRSTSPDTPDYIPESIVK